MLKLEPYAAQLEKTGGVIAEFVNPKCVNTADHSASEQLPRGLLKGCTPILNVDSLAYCG